MVYFKWHVTCHLNRLRLSRHFGRYCLLTWSALWGLLSSVFVCTEAMLGFMRTTSMPSSFNALIACDAQQDTMETNTKVSETTKHYTTVRQDTNFISISTKRYSLRQDSFRRVGRWRAEPTSSEPRGTRRRCCTAVLHEASVYRQQRRRQCKANRQGFCSCSRCGINRDGSIHQKECHNMHVRR